MTDIESLLKIAKIAPEDAVKCISKIMGVPKLVADKLLRENSDRLQYALALTARQVINDRIEAFQTESLALATDTFELGQIEARTPAPDTVTFPALRRLLDTRPTYFVFKGRVVYALRRDLVAYATIRPFFERPVLVRASILRAVINRASPFEATSAGLRTIDDGLVYGTPPLATVDYGELTLRPWDFHDQPSFVQLEDMD